MAQQRHHPTTCYIAATSQGAFAAIQQIVTTRHLDIVGSDALPANAESLLALRGEAIAGADLCIVLLNNEGHNNDAFFVLGYAAALHKRILVISPPGAESLPLSLMSLPQVIAQPEDAEAITFMLDQVLASPTHALDGPIKAVRESHPIESKLGQDLQEKLTNITTEQQLLNVVTTMLTASGIELIVEQPMVTIDQGVQWGDLGVWVEDSDPAVGSLVLIELRTQIATESRGWQIRDQLARYLHESPARTALVLYLDGPTSLSALSRPDVIILSVRSLLEHLQVEGFGAILRELRVRATRQVAA